MKSSLLELKFLLTLIYHLKNKSQEEKIPLSWHTVLQIWKQ